MKKLFLVPLMALMTCVSVYAMEVSTLQELKTALAAGGVIKLTANITASEALNITKATTIDGNGFALKNTNQDALGVNTSEAVVVKNLTVYAAHQNNGRAIGVNATTSNITLDNVVFNCNARGVTYNKDANVNCVLNVKNSTIQYVLKNPSAPATTLKNAEVDEWGNPLNINYDECAPGKYARGISLWEMTHSTVTIDNSTIQGFDYDVNCAPDVQNGNPDYTGTSVTATKSIFKGRCAYNIHVGNAVFEFTDCTVTGVNCFSGPSESFACFVLDGGSHNCKLTINGGSAATARFTDDAYANENAREFMVTDRGKNNKIVINNASYTCPKDLGVQKGGVFENVGAGSTATINGGTYDCPEIIENNEGGEVIINEGDFDVLIVTSTAYYPKAYESDFDNVANNITINGGTFENAIGEDINALTFANNEEKDPVSLVGNAVETYENQDGTVSVVPQGTEAATEKVDPAIKTNLVWGTDIALTAKNVKLQQNQTLTLNSGAASADKLDLGQNTKVIIKDGAKLTIGEGGVALNNNGAQYPQIIVEAGGVVIVRGQMYGSVVENLLIQTSEAKHGVLLFDPDMNTYGDNHPKGTVEFITKSYYVGGSDYQFERFGIPTWTTVESIDCDVAGLVTTLYVFANNGWQKLGDLVKGTPFANVAQLNKPFATYNLLARQATPGATYKIAGALSGNGNAELYANLKWNSFANSYTADVNVGKLLEELEGASDIDATVYVLEPAGNHTYVPDAIDAVWAASTKIAPMQTFLLNNVGGNNEYTSINYKNAVWSPATASAPARRKQVHDLTAKLRINVMNEQGVWDNLRMSESMTNMHNAEKYMGEDINLYAYDGDDKLAIVAAEDLNGTYIGFSTVNGGKFTLSFANVEGREFDLIDLEENVTVSVVEGNTYTFSAAKNTNADYRFKLVESKRVVTDVDNIAAEKNVKGIYTIMGQYVGEMNMWNNLPAGIYVVNGEKRVK